MSGFVLAWCFYGACFFNVERIWEVEDFSADFLPLDLCLERDKGLAASKYI